MLDVMKNYNNQDFYQSIILNMEENIRNGRFDSKENLVRYINELKEKNIPTYILTNEKITEFLNLYDELSSKSNFKLDIQNYKGASLDDQNFIISTEDDKVVKTSNSSEELVEEFKKTQNQMTAKGDDGLANADMVFDNMRKYQKEELSLMSLSEAIEKDNVSFEILNKIKFFVSNEYVNPYSYKVDVNNGIFYNVETNEVLEVRKNDLGNYEIYKGGERQFKQFDDGNSIGNEFSSDENNEEKVKDTDEDIMAYDKKNVKVRRLTKPINNNHAFIKSSLIVICITIASILLSLLMLLIKIN